MTRTTLLRVASNQCTAGRPIPRRTCALPVKIRVIPENEIPRALHVDIYLGALLRRQAPLYKGAMKKGERCQFPFAQGSYGWCAGRRIAPLHISLMVRGGVAPTNYASPFGKGRCRAERDGGDRKSGLRKIADMILFVFFRKSLAKKPVL